MTIYDTRSCTGCRTCEMACSFHHARLFRPSVSSIEVTGSAAEGFKISLYQSPEKDRAACDGCPELEEPLCVMFCPVVAAQELAECVRRSRRATPDQQSKEP